MLFCGNVLFQPIVLSVVLLEDLCTAIYDFFTAMQSTLNGICAASGKAGALIGSMAFAFAISRFGEEVVMMACAGVSLIGMVVTLSCVSEITTQYCKTEPPHVPMMVVISESSLVDCYDAV